MTETRRERLPNRRRATTIKVAHGAHAMHLTLGRLADGAPLREIFINTSKDGTEMRHLLQDTAAIVSIALQHGVSLEALTASLGRLDGKPMSAIGAALDAARADEAAEAEAVA